MTKGMKKGKLKLIWGWKNFHSPKGIYVGKITSYIGTYFGKNIDMIGIHFFGTFYGMYRQYSSDGVY